MTKEKKQTKIENKKDVVKKGKKNTKSKIVEENKTTKKHNGIISFWKFAFAVMIVIYHAKIFQTNGGKTIFPKGSIGVEFFFLVSGYLLFKSALNKKDDNTNLGKETLMFIGKKLKVFLPYTILAGIIALIVLNIYDKPNIYTNISSIWDILLLRMAGFRGKIVNIPIWYISSMLLCMTILYPLIRKYKYQFIYLFVPLIIALGFGYLNKNFVSLRDPDIWLGWTYKGNIRAFVELSLGGILYILCEKIKKIDFTKLGRCLITIVEIVGLIIPFIMSQFIEKTPSYDYIVVGIIFISVLFAFSEKTLEYELFNNKVFFWLEKLSFPMYVFHYPIRLFISRASVFSKMNYMSKIPIYLIITLIVSIVSMYVLDFLKKRNYFIDKIKKLIIKEKKI